MPIVAIGGGEIAEGQTFNIDQFIVSHTHKPQPRALFIPTASNDAPGYIETFHRVYGEELGCHARALTLTDEPDDAEIVEAIDWADLIYVGGGNTRKMLKLWRERGVDQLLQQAFEADKMLCGLSAGAICWFEAGFSDSDSFEAEGDWQFTRVDGLGFVPGLFCPHLDSEQRTLPLLNHLAADPIPALAATDLAAIVVNDGQMSVLAERPGAAVYRIDPEGDRLGWSKLD